MIIDCGQCTVRGEACADCVVTFLTIGVREEGAEPRRAGIGPFEAGPFGAGPAGPGPNGAELPGPRRAQPALAAPDLDAAEREAIDVLARSGLVPPLRLARDESQRRAV